MLFMKAIKIILVIITVLVLAFFLTGLFVKETTYLATTSINKPLDVVFTKFNESEKIKNWIPEIKTFEVLEEKPGKVGSTYKVVVESNGQEITMTEKVLSYVPNEKVTLFFDAENMLKTDDYLFTDEEGKTVVKLNSSCQSDSYIMACLFPYFKGTFQKQDQQYLDNFKAYIESN